MSITSETHIVNNALIRLGAKNITDLDTDGTHTSSTMVQLYAPTRDALLRQHFWNFAVKRVSLAEEVTPPAFEWEAQYTLPADFIRLKKLYNTDSDYAIEGSSILVNQPSELQLVYVSRITDVTAFDPLFTQVLILMLAVLAASRIAGEAYKTDGLFRELGQLLAEAKIVDAQDGSADRFVISALTDARQSFSWDRWSLTNDDV